MIYPRQDGHNPKDNRILAALQSEEMERLLSHMEQVELRLGEVISLPNEPIKYVYFPHRGTISITSLLEDGSQVEVGVVGNEGMYGMPVALGTDTSPHQAIVQITGGATRMSADVLREEVGRCGRLHNLLLRYGQALFVMVAQNAACNRRHPLDGRLCRWLLTGQDRIKSDELKLTHEFLSVMLGVRRAGISESASKLQSQGLISYKRGRVHILDRQGLEAISCECYEVVKKEFDRLLAA
jgi:CRP-like cAMP-binding protein